MNNNIEGSIADKNREIVRDGGFLYVILKGLIKICMGHYLYKKIYYVGKNHIQPRGRSQIVVANHQNCLIDAIGIVTSIDSYTFRPHFWARADIFEVNKTLEKFLRYVGVMPAYRLSESGYDSLYKNLDSIQEGKILLNAGGTLGIFPEAGHQDKRYLGEFTLNYLKIAFEVAQESNFEKEIFILPSANHYSSYFGIREQMAILYDEPISLKEYYQEYKTHPRTTCRKVNLRVRESIKRLMLNIDDLPNYDAIDFIRNNYTDKFAKSHSLPYHTLPEKLSAEKIFVAKLDELKHSGKESLIESIYSQAIDIKNGLDNLKIKFKTLSRKPSVCKMVYLASILILCFPLWVLSLWPHALIYKIPQPFIKRMKDKMLTSSFMLGISVVFTIPVFYILSFIIIWICFSIYLAIIMTILSPFLAIFCWNYTEWWAKFKEQFRLQKFYKSSKNDIFARLKLNSENLEDRLWSIFKSINITLNR